MIQWVYMQNNYKSQLFVILIIFRINHLCMSLGGFIINKTKIYVIINLHAYNYQCRKIHEFKHPISHLCMSLDGFYFKFIIIDIFI